MTVDAADATPDLAEIAKQPKDVFDAIERVTKLEGELQQQLGKIEPPDQRKLIANELASAVGARLALVLKRGELLESLNGGTRK